MATPYVGEIRLFGGDYAPPGWLMCDGRFISSDEHPDLFALIGTTYGGDGAPDFALPNLNGRAPMHRSAQDPLGATGGTPFVTLSPQNLPTHNHGVLTTADPGTTSVPAGMVPASITVAGTVSAYGTSVPLGAIDSSVISTEGGSNPHENRQPYLCVSYIICLAGSMPHAPHAEGEQS